MINNKEDETATPKILSQSEVTAIRERAAKATPGPWVNDDPSWEESDVSICNMGGSFAACSDKDEAQQNFDNGDFVAHSRTDVPALCDTIDALRARLEVAKAELQGIVEYWNGAPESAVDAIETVADRAHNCLAQLKEPQ